MEVELNDQFTAYVKRMQKVRLLSTPSLDDINEADDYSRLLLENFRKIGEYALENRRMLDEVLFPLLKLDRPLSDQEVDRLRELSTLLVDGEMSMEIDLHLSELIDDCLYQEEDLRLDAQNGNEENAETQIRLLQRRLDVAYARLTYSGRSNPTEWKKLLDDGLVYYEEALVFLSKSYFSRLSEEARENLVMMVINGTAMLNTRPNALGNENLALATRQKDMLDSVASVLEDPFYTGLLSEGFLEKAKFYVTAYIGALSFLEGVSNELYAEAYSCAFQIEERWRKDPEFVGTVLYESAVHQMVLYAAYRVDSPELDRCIREVVEYYEAREESDYSYVGTSLNLGYAKALFVVLGGIHKRDPGRLSQQLEELLYTIPRDILGYLHRSPKREDFASYVNMLSSFLEYFEELPGGFRMRNYCVYSMAAMHPPTYIHSYMVAKLSLCLTRHLLSMNPAAFCGFPGCQTVEDVLENRNKIMDYAWHAALYHDIGKLYVLDTIAMYGRRLLDSEYVLLRSHPDKGAELASRFDTTRDYADVIRGHHIWYDGSNGYPENFDVLHSPYKAIIDIVSVADCLDAATDSVGRSYRQGRTLAEFQEELKKGAGTRYAPYVAQLFEDPATYQDISYLLKNGRKKLYDETYFLLKDLLKK